MPKLRSTGNASHSTPPPPPRQTTQSSNPPALFNKPSYNKPPSPPARQNPPSIPSRNEDTTPSWKKNAPAPPSRSAPIPPSKPGITNYFMIGPPAPPRQGLEAPTSGYAMRKSNTAEIADRFQMGSGGLKTSASQGSFRGSQGSVAGNTERDGRWNFRTDIPPPRIIEVGRRESVRRAAPPPPPARRGPPPVPSRN
jgi:hypothetical protein